LLYLYFSFPLSAFSFQLYLSMSKSIAIILPAYNEELTIADTMRDFTRQNER